MEADVNHPCMSGQVEVICGSMFSGKTEELLRRIRRATIAKQKVQLFKPQLDNRYSEDHVQSHDSNRLPSTVVGSAAELFERVDDMTRVIGIDEIQFFDERIVDVVQRLANQGRRVICVGLDLDYRGQPFGAMPALLCIAEEVTKLAAVCPRCGGKATRSQLLAVEGQDEASGNPIRVGAKELYEPRCRAYHEAGPAVSQF